MQADPEQVNPRAFRTPWNHAPSNCDRISHRNLDAFLVRDPLARVADKTFAADSKVLVAGEFRTARGADYEAVRAEAEAIVRRTLRTVGYSSKKLDMVGRIGG